MTMLRSIRPVIWFSGMLLVSTVTGTSAQVPEPKGPVAKPLLNLDLAPEMERPGPRHADATHHLRAGRLQQAAQPQGSA